MHRKTVTSPLGTGLRIRIKTIGESTESLIRKALRTVANRLTNRAHNLHITTILITSRPGVWHDFKIKLSADDHEQKEIDRSRHRRDRKTSGKRNGGTEKQNREKDIQCLQHQEDRPQQWLAPKRGSNNSNRDT